MKKILLAITVLTVMVFGGYYEDATKANKAGYYKKSAELYTKAAEQGHVGALFSLALLYKYGEGVKPDDKKSMELYTKAAEQGHADAQFILGRTYDYRKDYKKAAEFYSKAADQGVRNAQYNLGVLYYEGKGLNINKIKTFQYWMKAAKQGHTSAQENLDKLCKESPWACK